MLAKINWTFFVKEEQFAETMTNLVEAICSEMRTLSETSTEERNEDDDVESEECFVIYCMLFNINEGLLHADRVFSMV